MELQLVAGMDGPRAKDTQARTLSLHHREVEQNF